MHDLDKQFWSVSSPICMTDKHYSSIFIPTYITWINNIHLYLFKHTYFLLKWETNIILYRNSLCSCYWLTASKCNSVNALVMR